MNFDLHGIHIRHEYEYEETSYKVEYGREKTRREKVYRTHAGFWHMGIEDKDLTGFSVLKSATSFFGQFYWRRSGHEGKRINLSVKLIREWRETEQELEFSAKQKGGISFLHVCQKDDGQIIGEAYLNAMEVNQLDIALGKVISLMGASKSAMQESRDNSGCEKTVHEVLAEMSRRY